MAAAHTLSGAGIAGTLELVEEGLRVELHAPGPGWVVLGLSDKSGLEGAQFAMVAALPDGTVRAEHHITRPPNHWAVESDWIRSATAVDGDGTTVVLLLDPSGQSGGPAIVQGSTVFVTLAWSVSDDFEHHSRQRTEVVLNW